jgi:threonine/homoserine/homoserine lactone efflux protein
MDIGLLFRGIVIGLAIAAPVGPVGVLCIRRTLADRRASGFVSGLGAASADAIYGSIAALGLTFVSTFLIEGEAWLRMFGGTFLLVLGGKIFVERPAERAAPTWGSGLLSAYASTFLLTLTNPTTILSFAAIFAGLGAGGETEVYLSTTLLVLGVFLGSALWWLLLSGVVGLLRTKLSPGGLRWVNRVSGVVVAGLGLLALSRFLG